MSTKAIRELIERAKKEAAPITRSAVGWPDAGLMADKALLEVDAIESACKRIAGGYIKVRAHDDEDDHHVALLDNIGEEASK